MSQPFQTQPSQQPPMSPPPPAVKPPKRKRFGFLALCIAALSGLLLGGIVGGAGDSATVTAAAPAPTVTATRTVTAPPVGEGEGTEAPESEPTAEPAGWNPKPKDFKVGIKVTDKECFGSAGCNISYKIKLDLLTAQEIPDEGSTDITYKITGAEDPILGTITLDSEGRFDSYEESASTRSSGSKLTAKVTEVEYNEFG